MNKHTKDLLMPSGHTLNADVLIALNFSTLSQLGKVGMLSRDYKRTNTVPRIFETRRSQPARGDDSAALTRSKKKCH